MAPLPLTGGIEGQEREPGADGPHPASPPTAAVVTKASTSRNADPIPGSLAVGHPGVAHRASPLVRRPYDLRHAAVSLRLNAGVPATEVDRHAGHGVAVLLKVYANSIDGQAGPANQRDWVTPGPLDGCAVAGAALHRP